MNDQFQGLIILLTTDPNTEAASGNSVIKEDTETIVRRSDESEIIISKSDDEERFVIVERA